MTEANVETEVVITLSTMTMTLFGSACDYNDRGGGKGFDGLRTSARVFEKQVDRELVHGLRRRQQAERESKKAPFVRPVVNDDGGARRSAVRGEERKQQNNITNECKHVGKEWRRFRRRCQRESGGGG